jgi:hypothetical protein
MGGKRRANTTRMTGEWHDAIGEVIEGSLDFRRLFINQGDQVEVRIFRIDSSGAKSIENSITHFCKSADNFFSIPGRSFCLVLSWPLSC